MLNGKYEYDKKVVYLLYTIEKINDILQVQEE